MLKTSEPPPDLLRSKKKKKKKTEKTEKTEKTTSTPPSLNLSTPFFFS